ncbi:MAG: hypothetical protein KAS71_01110 [Bacteroidales bacterium]|nr:hypothetical protein [Bacteroidales bacterium]
MLKSFGTPNRLPIGNQKHCPLEAEVLASSQGTCKIRYGENTYSKEMKEGEKWVLNLD